MSSNLSTNGGVSLLSTVYDKNGVFVCVMVIAIKIQISWVLFLYPFGYWDSFWLFTHWYMFQFIVTFLLRDLSRTLSISCSFGRTLQIINVTSWMWQNTSTDQTQTLLAIGTSYVQGEDVAAKGRIILVSVGQDPQDPSSWVRLVHHLGANSCVGYVCWFCFISSERLCQSFLHQFCKPVTEIELSLQHDSAHCHAFPTYRGSLRCDCLSHALDTIYNMSVMLSQVSLLQVSSEFSSLLSVTSLHTIDADDFHYLFKWQW